MKYTVFLILAMLPIISMAQPGTSDTAVRVSDLRGLTVATAGKDATGALIPIPVGGMVASTTTTLAPNQTWASDTFYYNGNNNIQLAIFTDVPGTYIVQYFRKNGSLVPFMGNTVSFDPSVVNAFQAAIAGKGDGVKITYINGPVAQGQFYLELGLLNTTVQETQRSMGIPMSGTNLGSTNHSAIEGRDSTLGASAFKQVTTSTIAKKVGLDVNIINRNNETQNVALVGPVSVSNLDTSVTITSPLPVGSNTIGNVNINGAVPVTGTFWPTTQPVSGSVSVSNFPATQAVDSTKYRKVVTVDNLPSTYAVAGALSITNPYSVVATDSTKYRKVLSVDNFPTNYNVSGTVSISNPVSSVSVSNFPDSTKTRLYQQVGIVGTPSVTVANPTVQDSTKTRLIHQSYILGTPNVNIGNTVPVTVAALPLPSGASTLANDNTNIGTVSDAAVTDQTATGSVISLLKGLLAETMAPATTGNFTALTLAANVAQTVAAAPTAKGRIIFSTNGTILLGFGFNATATNYAVRLVTNGMYEVPPLFAGLPVSIFSTNAGNVNVFTAQ